MRSPCTTGQTNRSSQRSRDRSQRPGRRWFEPSGSASTGPTTRSSPGATAALPKARITSWVGSQSAWLKTDRHAVRGRRYCGTDGQATAQRGEREYFARGEPDMAPDGQYHERGIVGAHGFMAEYFTSPAEFLVEIPPALAEWGFLVEPVSISRRRRSNTPTPAGPRSTGGAGVGVDSRKRLARAADGRDSRRRV